MKILVIHNSDEVADALLGESEESLFEQFKKHWLFSHFEKRLNDIVIERLQYSDKHLSAQELADGDKDLLDLLEFSDILELYHDGDSWYGVTLIEK